MPLISVVFTRRTLHQSPSQCAFLLNVMHLIAFRVCCCLSFVGLKRTAMAAIGHDLQGMMLKGSHCLPSKLPGYVQRLMWKDTGKGSVYHFYEIIPIPRGRSTLQVLIIYSSLNIGHQPQIFVVTMILRSFEGQTK